MSKAEENKEGGFYVVEGIYDICIYLKLLRLVVNLIQKNWMI